MKLFLLLVFVLVVGELLVLAIGKTTTAKTKGDFLTGQKIEKYEPCCMCIVLEYISKGIFSFVTVAKLIIDKTFRRAPGEANFSLSYRKTRGNRKGGMECNECKLQNRQGQTKKLNGKALYTGLSSLKIQGEGRSGAHEFRDERISN